MRVGKGGSYWSTFMEQYKANPEYFGYKPGAGQSIENYGNKLVAEYANAHHLIKTENGEVLTDVRIKSPEARVTWFMKDGQLSMLQDESGTSEIGTYTHDYKSNTDLSNGAPVAEKSGSSVTVAEGKQSEGVLVEPVKEVEVPATKQPEVALASPLEKLVGGHKEYLEDANFKSYLIDRAKVGTLAKVSPEDIKELYTYGEQFKDNYKFSSVDYNFLDTYKNGDLKMGVANDAGVTKFMLFDESGQNEVSPLSGRHIAINLDKGEIFNKQTFDKYFKAANQLFLNEQHVYKGTVNVVGPEATREILSSPCGGDLENKVKEITTTKLLGFRTSTGRGADLYKFYTDKLLVDLKTPGATVGERLAETLATQTTIDNMEVGRSESVLTGMQAQEAVADKTFVPIKTEQLGLESQFDNLENHSGNWDGVVQDIVNQELTNTPLYNKHPEIRSILEEMKGTQNIKEEILNWETHNPEKVQILWGIIDREYKNGNADVVELKQYLDQSLEHAAESLIKRADDLDQRVQAEQLIGRADSILGGK